MPKAAVELIIDALGFASSFEINMLSSFKPA